MDIKGNFSCNFSAKITGKIIIKEGGNMEINEIYKCEVCGNVVEAVQFATGEISCCGKEMVKLIPNTKDAATEKHVPVVEEKEGGYLVKIGSVAHPMLEEHFIEFIEVIYDNNKIMRAYLRPGVKPEAWFPKADGNIIEAREYCNLHGLWSNKK